MKTLILSIIVAISLITPAFGAEITPLSIIGDLKNATSMQVEDYSDKLVGTQIKWKSTVQDVAKLPGVENVYLVKLSTGEGKFTLNAVYISLNKHDALLINKGMVLVYAGSIKGVNSIMGINIAVTVTNVNIIK